MQRHDETEWLQLARDGDAQAFSELVEIYQRPVYNLCYRMLGNAQEAEDAAQEAFIRAFNSLQRYDPERKFATWLLSIAANYCIDQHRRKRFVNVDLEAVPASEFAERKPSIEKEMINQEANEEIQALLAGLNEKDRAAIILHYWYDYSYREIAKELTLSESAVKSRLHRARQSLAQSRNDQMANPLIGERRQHETAIA